MNNRGIAILESVIVTSTVIVMFTVMYTYVSQLISNYNARNKYDLVENTYKLNNIRAYIYSYGNINDIIYGDVMLNPRTITSIKNLNFNNNTKYNNIYIDMLDDMNEERIYFIYSEYIDGDLTNESELSTGDNNFDKYIKYITNKYRYKYRIVAKFKDNEYAQIKLWEVVSS